MSTSPTPTQTNKSSPFTPFALPLPNGGQLGGLSFLPPAPSAAGQPLIVSLHGGTCTSANYDASLLGPLNPLHSNRPPLLRPEHIFPPPSPFFRETASWLHTQVLPLLWREFGLPNQCSGLVTTSHSMAVPPSIIAAATYASVPAPERAYPLAGTILSGFGTRFAPRDFRAEVTDIVTYPAAVKRELMLSAPELGCADPGLWPLLEAQTVPMHVEELVDFGVVGGVCG
ncbi:MAG: hypothetical protein MMC23_009052 [Stictis urceolatum]|nr:hypothetical protein [Stictis urceolata]